MNDEQMICIHVVVEGRVQGVGFRHFVWQHANQLELKGWVRNRWDGTVELIAEGDQETVNQLISFLWKGPRMSFVTQVKVAQREFTGEFRSFDIRSSI